MLLNILRPSATPQRVTPTQYPTGQLQPTRRATPTMYPTSRPTATLTPRVTSRPTLKPQSAKNIFGLVYVDLNNNGRRDSNENGFSGASLVVTNSSNQTLCYPKTSANGTYSCKVPAAGTYTVKLTIPNGLKAASKNPVTISIPQSIPSAGITFRLTR